MISLATILGVAGTVLSVGATIVNALADDKKWDEKFDKKYDEKERERNKENKEA